jgi:hypothetical protein
MALSSSEQFVTKLVRTCLPHTNTGIEFPMGAQFVNDFSELGYGFGARSGDMRISIQGGPDISVQFSILGVGDGKAWTEGKITLTFDLSSSDQQIWEFYCETATDGSMNVTPMPIKRQQRELKQSVEAAIARLGGNPEAKNRRLSSLGYGPGLTGLELFICQLFAFDRVEIDTISIKLRPYYQIRCTDNGRQARCVVIVCSCLALGQAEAHR